VRGRTHAHIHTQTHTCIHTYIHELMHSDCLMSPASDADEVGSEGEEGEASATLEPLDQSLFASRFLALSLSLSPLSLSRPL